MKHVSETNDIGTRGSLDDLISPRGYQLRHLNTNRMLRYGM